MRKRANKWLIILVFISLGACGDQERDYFSATSASPAGENKDSENADKTSAREKLRVSVSRAQVLLHEISNFIEFFGVEIIRETNMRQHGEISGTLDGNGKMLQIGNVQALSQGILGLGASGAAVATGTGFGFAAFPLERSVSSLLQGLAGWGYGSISIKGSIQGQFHGEGVQVHSDNAHLFLIMVKNQQQISTLWKQMDESIRHHNESGKTLDQTQLIADIKKLSDASHFATTDLVKGFKDRCLEFRKVVQASDSIISDNIGSNDPIFHAGESRIQMMKQWMYGKRVVFAQVAPKDLAAKIVDLASIYTVTLRPGFAKHDRFIEARYLAYEQKSNGRISKFNVEDQLFPPLTLKGSMFSSKSFYVASKPPSHWFTSYNKISSFDQLQNYREFLVTKTLPYIVSVTHGEEEIADFSSLLKMGMTIEEKRLDF